MSDPLESHLYLDPVKAAEIEQEREHGCPSCRWFAWGRHAKSDTRVRICDANQPAFPEGGKEICSWYDKKGERHVVHRAGGKR